MASSPHVCVSSPLKTRGIWDQGPTLFQCDLVLTNYIYRISKLGTHSEVLGVRTSTYLLGAHNVTLNSHQNLSVSGCSLLRE